VEDLKKIITSTLESLVKVCLDYEKNDPRISLAPLTKMFCETLARVSFKHPPPEDDLRLLDEYLRFSIANALFSVINDLVKGFYNQVYLIRPYTYHLIDMYRNMKASDTKGVRVVVV